MKKTFFLIVPLLVVLFLLIPHITFAYNAPNVWSPGILKGPLVSCTGDGSNGTQACQSLCDLIYTIINIVYFGIGMVIWIIAPILFAAGGIMYLMAGASTEMIGRAKKTLTGTVVGLIIVLCGWLIVNTFVRVVGIGYIGGFSPNSPACIISGS